jgi:hypothetical protein
MQHSIYLKKAVEYGINISFRLQRNIPLSYRRWQYFFYFLPRTRPRRRPDRAFTRPESSFLLHFQAFFVDFPGQLPRRRPDYLYLDPRFQAGNRIRVSYE